MDAIETLMSRRVQRAFAPRAVEEEKLARIVDAGRHAMSARNLQPWRFVIIRDPNRLRRIGALCSTGRFVARAPAAVAVLKDLSNARWADVDCAQAVQNMANAAWALGLGTCWVGNLDKEKIGEILEAPPGWEIFTVLPFGYTDPENPPQPRPLRRRSEVVHLETLGRR